MVSLRIFIWVNQKILKPIVDFGTLKNETDLKTSQRRLTAVNNKNTKPDIFQKRIPYVVLKLSDLYEYLISMAGKIR